LLKLLKTKIAIGIRVEKITALKIWCPCLFNTGFINIKKEVKKLMGLNSIARINKKDKFIKNTMANEMYDN